MHSSSRIDVPLSPFIHRTRRPQSPLLSIRALAMAVISAVLILLHMANTSGISSPSRMHNRIVRATTVHFAHAATVSRLYPGSGAWTRYYTSSGGGGGGGGGGSGGTLNTALANCALPNDASCSSSDTANGLGCKWNVARSDDLGDGLYAIIKFRQMSGLDNVAFTNEGDFWYDPIRTFVTPRVTFTSTKTGELMFDFVDSECNFITPIYNATIHMDAIGLCSSGGRGSGNVQTSEKLYLQDGKTWSMQTGNIGLLWDATMVTDDLTGTCTQTGTQATRNSTLENSGGSMLVAGDFTNTRVLGSRQVGTDYIKFTVGMNLLSNPTGPISNGTILDFRRARFPIYIRIQSADIEYGYEFIRQTDGSVTDIKFYFATGLAANFVPGAGVLLPTCRYVNASTAVCNFPYNYAFMPSGGRWNAQVFVSNKTITNNVGWFWSGIMKSVLFNTFTVSWGRSLTTSLSATQSMTVSGTDTASKTLDMTISAKGFNRTETFWDPYMTATRTGFSETKTRRDTQTLSQSHTVSRSPSGPTVTRTVSGTVGLTSSASGPTRTTSHTVTSSWSDNAPTLTESTSSTVTLSPTGTASNSHNASTMSTTMRETATRGTLSRSSSALFTASRSAPPPTGTITSPPPRTETIIAYGSLTHVRTLSVAPRRTKTHTVSFSPSRRLTQTANTFTESRGTLVATTTRSVSLSGTSSKGTKSHQASATASFTKVVTESTTVTKSESASGATKSGLRSQTSTISLERTPSTTLTVTASASSSRSITRSKRTISPSATASMVPKRSKTVSPAKEPTTTITPPEPRTQTPSDEFTETATVSRRLTESVTRISTITAPITKTVTATMTHSVSKSVIPTVIVSAPLLVRAVLTVARTRLVLVFRGVTQNEIDVERWLCKRAQTDFKLYFDEAQGKDYRGKDPSFGHYGLCGGIWWSGTGTTSDVSQSDILFGGSSSNTSVSTAERLTYLVLLLSGDAVIVPRNLRIGPTAENNVTSPKRAGGAPSPNARARDTQRRGFSAQAQPPVYYVYERLSVANIVPIEVDQDPSNMPRIEVEMGNGWTEAEESTNTDLRRGMQSSSHFPAWAIVVVTLAAMLLSMRLFLIARYFSKEYNVWWRIRYAWYQYQVERSGGTDAVSRDTLNVSNTNPDYVYEQPESNAYRESEYDAVAPSRSSSRVSTRTNNNYRYSPRQTRRTDGLVD